MTHHRGRSGRDNLFYLYEQDTGALAPKPSQIVRENPIPPGRYWVDVFGKNIPSAANWFKAMSGAGIHVDSTEHFTAPELSEIRDWYLFTYQPVLGIPVVWDQKTFGFLSLATPDIKSSQDTVQMPPPELGPLDKLSDWLNDVESTSGPIAKYGLLAGGALLAYWLLKESDLLGKAKRSVRQFRNR